MRSVSSSLLLVLLVSELLVTTTAARSVSEKSILLEFYQATNGPKWKTNHGWAEESDDFCGWHGVVCVGEEDDLEFSGELTYRNNDNADGSTYKVLGLNLKENNLVGRTPESLYTLPLLSSLVLSYNPNLDVSFLGGQAAKKLVQLKIHDTGISSLNGLANFQNSLENLHLSGNGIENTALPDELFTLFKLRELHMATCKFQGTLPEAISKLQALEVFNVYNNNLSGTIPFSFSQLTNLKVLTLTGNKFTGTIPTFLNNMVNLVDLYLDGNQFKGTIPALSGLKNIKVSYECERSERLYCMASSDQREGWWLGLAMAATSLVTLVSLLTLVSSYSLTTSTTHARTQEVFMNYNYLSGTFPSNFLSAAASTPDSLRIDLNGNRLAGTIPSTLDAFNKKKVLITLADNLFTGIDASLCDNTNWMDANQTFGCDGIVCPVGTYGSLGRKTAKHSCKTCDSALFVGQRYCLDRDDRGVLSAFYAATGGPNWYKQDNWMTDADVCDWYGVTCWDTTDSKKGRVRHLNLDGNNLKGVIPPSIYALETLTTITVSRNEVVMRFDAIRQAPHMRKINVANTDTVLFDGIENAHSFFAHLVADKLKIGGPIPSQIMQLSTLTTLSMSDCHLVGTISQDIGKMGNLTELYLHGNALHGQIPTHFGNLKKLQMLSLAKNKLTGVIPDTIDQMMSLQALSLSDQVSKGGGISGDLPDFSSNMELTSLFLANNEFEGTIPANLLRGADLDQSLTVDLSSNVLTGTVPGALSRFATLNLKTQDNFISGVDKRLCVLDGWMNGNVRDYGCDAILCPASTSAPTGKRMFDNDGCRGCGEGDGVSFYGQTTCGERDVVLTEREILLQLYDGTDGQNWHTNDNWYTNAHYCEWYGITCDSAKSVVNIALGSNKLKGYVPTAIYQLPNLARLSLFSNDIDISFEGIDRARSLRSLILDSTGLNSLEGIGEARGLKELNVRFNELQGTIPSEIQRLVHLEAMELSDNNLSGPIPSWMGKLLGLDTLVLAKNNLHGPLPDFADLPNIVFLDLSHNQFTGQVPPSLLENTLVDEKLFVDLSDNRLTGTVPADLKRMERLQIHLQNNQITAVDDELCKVNGWNDNDVQQYGCKGIMCPVGTYNVAGRQTADNGDCDFCKVAKYMGQTKCSGALRTLASVGAMASFVVSTVYLML